MSLIKWDSHIFYSICHPVLVGLFIQRMSCLKQLVNIECFLQNKWTEIFYFKFYSLRKIFVLYIFKGISYWIQNNCFYQFCTTKQDFVLGWLFFCSFVVGFFLSFCVIRSFHTKNLHRKISTQFSKPWYFNLLIKRAWNLSCLLL